MESALIGVQRNMNLEGSLFHPWGLRAPQQRALGQISSTKACVSSCGACLKPNWKVVGYPPNIYATTVLTLVL